MSASKEKLSDSKEDSEKKEKFLPLSLNTPDLTPRERQLLESASEKLVGKQIDRMFEENSSLREAAEAFSSLRPGEIVPKEEEMLRDAHQKQKLKENISVSPEVQKLIAFADEFRRMPSKFRLFEQWLNEAEKKYADQSAFQTLHPKMQQKILEFEQSIHDSMSGGKNINVPDDAAIIEMANAINCWIIALSKLGVPNSALSRDAFTVWLNTRNMGREGTAGNQSV